MPENIGGKRFYSPEEAETLGRATPTAPEVMAASDAIIERRVREIAEEQARIQRGETPARYAADQPARFGRDEFDGTEYEQWAKDQWATEDQLREQQRKGSAPE